MRKIKHKSAVNYSKVTIFFFLNIKDRIQVQILSVSFWQYILKKY